MQTSPSRTVGLRDLQPRTQIPAGCSISIKEHPAALPDVRRVSQGPQAEVSIMMRELCDLSVVDLLHRASQSADVTFVRHVGDRLNARQYAVMRAVAQGEGLSQQAIVEATGIDRSTLASMVQRLVRRGLLQRRRTKRDARAYAVRLTAAGKDALMKLEPGAQNADAQLLATIQSSRRVQLRSALMDLIEATHRD